MKNLKFGIIALLLTIAAVVNYNHAAAQRSDQKNIYNIQDSGKNVYLVVNGYGQLLPKGSILLNASSTSITISVLGTNSVLGGNSNYYASPVTASSWRINLKTYPNNRTHFYGADSITFNGAALNETVPVALHWIDSVNQNKPRELFIQCAANSDSTVFYAHPCRGKFTISNAGAGIATVKLYDTVGRPKRASGTGSGTPTYVLVKIIIIPAGGSVTVGDGDGITFTHGCAVRVGGATAYFLNENGHTNSTILPAAGQITVNAELKQ